MQSITELRESMIKNYEALESGKMSSGKCKELANMAGKIIYSAKVQLDYLAYKGSNETIPFLQSKPE